MSTFFNKYKQRKQEVKSLLCIGLDPVFEALPKGYHSSKPIEACRDFLRDIIQLTKDYAVAYKPNCAFFEALGPSGMLLFAEVIQMISQEAPGALTIADAKRGDISHSAQAYAKAFFDELNCDAVTLNPYMGMDCLFPFIRYIDRASMVLCFTSNPGSLDFQCHGQPKLHLKIAETIHQENQRSKNLWLVVGAQDQERMSEIRRAAPDIPFLVPGIGKQGGEIKKCLDKMGSNILMNVGRSILYTAKNRQQLQKMVPAQCRALTKEMARR